MSSVAENSTRHVVSSIPGWLVFVLLMAAIMAAYFGELVTDANKLRFFTPEGLPPFPPELLREIMWNNIYNHSICFGFFGAVLCGLLVMITASMASPGRGLAGFVIGSALGVVLGAAVGVLGYFLYGYLEPLRIESILVAMILYAPVWIVLGIVTCVTSVLLVGRSDLVGKAIGMGLLMALCTIIVYPFFVTFAFPADWPGQIIPEHPRTRLSSYIIGSVGVVVALFLTFKSTRQKSPEITAAAS